MVRSTFSVKYIDVAVIDFPTGIDRGAQLRGHPLYVCRIGKNQLAAFIAILLIWMRSVIMRMRMSQNSLQSQHDVLPSCLDCKDVAVFKIQAAQAWQGMI